MKLLLKWSGCRSSLQLPAVMFRAQILALNFVFAVWDLAGSRRINPVGMHYKVRIPMLLYPVPMQSAVAIRLNHFEAILDLANIRHGRRILSNYVVLMEWEAANSNR